MALKSSITASVNNAFNLIGDLGENINFTNAAATSYDFNSGNVITQELPQVTIKGIVSKQYKDISDNPRLLTDIVLKSADVSGVDLDNYDTINFRSNNWNVNKVDDNGFIVNITVSREI